jgi:fused signal recognition particle receptor
MRFFSRLRQGLAKTSGSFTGVLTKRKLDQAALDELEEALIKADVGPKTAAKIIGNFAKNRFDKEIGEDEIKTALAKEIEDILAPVVSKLELKTDKKPKVIMFVGVNGTGKTTTIGKLSAQAKQEKLKCVIAACDTFRAAAVDQLKTWAERSGHIFYSGEANADPASVAFKAYEEAIKQKADILFIDTAGRLQNKKALMDELAKIVRVLKKHDEALPHETILVLDATTGQNAISQAEIFKEIANVSGIIITKLDGSAKGGVVVALADSIKLPIMAVGVGEGIDDLNDFSAEDFSKALIGLN